MMSTYDTEVLVAGGGPAGLAAAIASRQQGLAVTLVDCAVPPIDKACGEGIMPDGLAALSKLGVELPAACTYPFRGIRFINHHHATEASFIQGIGYGIRRTRLHEILVEKALKLSVDLRWGQRITALTSRGVLVNGREITCKWLIGADGQNSRV